MLEGGFQLGIVWHVYYPVGIVISYATGKINAKKIGQREVLTGLPEFIAQRRLVISNHGSTVLDVSPNLVTLDV